jgi:MarR family transcriptional regulator, transcriptional regulator for hemolysin
MMVETAPPPGPTLGLIVHDVARLLRRLFEQRARDAGLPRTRNLCMVLWHVAREPGMSQAALAQLLDVEPITLARFVDRLEEVGLLERRFNPRDRRVWMLHLTPAARPVVEQIIGVSRRVQDEAFAGVEEAERDALIAGLKRLKKNLSRRAPAAVEDSEAALPRSSARP